MKKKKLLLKRIGIFLALFSVLLSALFAASIRWMFRTWNNLTMDELLFHMTAPLAGTNEGMVREYIFSCIRPAVLAGVLMGALFVCFRKNKYFYVIPLLTFSCSLAVSILAAGYTFKKLDIAAYLEGRNTESTFIEDHYVPPADTELVFPEKKRNLIYIFLESVESTYADKEHGGAFEENCIPELTKLAEENEDFSGEEPGLNGGYTTTGATWTMGAMFAHTSGLPLSISIDGNDMDTQDSFFAGVVTLGDILGQAGYAQTLLIGSEAVFGGRRLYFKEHGNYEIMDYDYARKNKLIPKDYKVWWGFEDEKLFDIAKDKLTKLAKVDKPFNLTMLTVDTHFEDGYICGRCRKDFGDDQYANVMACSSRQIDEFISWVKEQDFYENTSIVLAGDHLTMDKDFCEGVDEEYERKVYTNFINPGCSLKNKTYREYTTFDLFPTTLAALGVDIKGGRLGLGTDLFSGTQTLTEQFGLSKQRIELTKKSSFMEELADIDAESEELLAREEERRPKAKIKVKDGGGGEVLIAVKGIKNVPEAITGMRLAVWTEGKEKQYVEMKKKKKGVYTVKIREEEFTGGEKNYHICAYADGKSGEEYILSEKDVSAKDVQQNQE